MIKRIYISGGISNVPDYKKKFQSAADILEKFGYEVVNPAKVIDFMPKSATYDQIMEIDLVLLRQCDGIYMLDGWKESKGAVLEHDTAKRQGMKVFYSRLFE